ncbi:NUDIX domain-containing protein [Ditylenchus destructor]|uniref:NUDIX domain-containing protein n=1 Tax=Ditylenchus destructor TaxID=166010 RepID=A0AAD4MGN0_9BILA|nr:NUDIX domain-containing protein [Ditylenchus destructor]
MANFPSSLSFLFVSCIATAISIKVQVHKLVMEGDAWKTEPFDETYTLTLENKNDADELRKKVEKLLKEHNEKKNPGPLYLAFDPARNGGIPEKDVTYMKPLQWGNPPKVFVPMATEVKFKIEGDQNERSVYLTANETWSSIVFSDIAKELRIKESDIIEMHIDGKNGKPVKLGRDVINTKGLKLWVKVEGHRTSLTPVADDGLDDLSPPFFTQPFIGDINVCRNTDIPYEGTEKAPIKRKLEVNDYFENRPKYTPAYVKAAKWADPDYETKKEEYKKIKFNVIDTSTGKSVDRRSYYLSYYGIKMESEVIGDVSLPLFPMFPKVKLGLGGRGKLGRYFVNHTGDAILSHKKDGKLRFVAIQRSSNHKWGMPGGFVDPKPKNEKREIPRAAAKRELKEEALLGIKPKTKDEDIMEIFKKLQETDGHYKELAVLLNDIEESKEICERKIYQGIVPDGRNVDNAHIETTVYNWHILDDKLAARIKPVYSCRRLLAR